MSKIGKWMVMAFASAAVIGCGGQFVDINPGGGSGGGSSSGGSTSGGTTSGGSGRLYPAFALPSNGVVQVAVLGGLDRRAVGSQVAVLDNLAFEEGVSDRIPDPSQNGFPSLSVVLDEYRLNTAELAVQFGLGVSKRTFTDFPFQISKLMEIQPDGTATDIPIGASPVFAAAAPYDVDMTVIPGRYTALQVRLDNEIVKFSNLTGFVFDEDKFQSVNYNTSDKIPTFFSDYLSFDLTSMSASDRPTMSGGGAADQVYFSGDGIAISRGMGTGSTFELLAPIAIQSGVVRLGPTIGGRPTTNSYTLTDTNPGLSTQAALTGIWRAHTDVVTGTGDVTMIAFPNNGDTASQQLVIYRSSGSTVTAMWQGQVDYDEEGAAGTFKLFPVSTVDDAIPSTEVVTGTISGIIKENGAIKFGTWAVTGSTPGSWQFGSTGGFGVYRK